MTEHDDDLLGPKLSAPPSTSPLAAGAVLGAALVIGGSIVGCALSHERTPDAARPGEAPSDANVSYADASVVDAGPAHG